MIWVFWVAIAAIGFAGGYAIAGGWGQQARATRLAQLDGFTPSMARWGYVGTKRGGR